MAETGEKLEKFGKSLQDINVANSPYETMNNQMNLQTPTINALSDERCKKSILENEGVSKCISNINAYLFKYKPEFQGKFGADGDEHLGVMAQELEANPLTRSAVKEIDGTKVVDTKQMAMIDMALIVDLANRVKALEDKLNG